MKHMTAEQTNREPSLTTPEEVIAQVDVMKITSPDNRMAKFFPKDYYLSLSNNKQKEVLRIVKPGLVNEGCEIGAYAMTTSDYETFAPVLDPIVQDYHGIEKDFRFKGDWNIEGNDLDLKNIDSKLADVSMRVRVARNVEGFPL